MIWFDETLLHFIWQYKIFAHLPLTTTKGEEIKIIKLGQHNKQEGPDFENAILKINETEWRGNIEIHIKSSDWVKHKHHQQKKYNNIILHVVYENDSEISHLPTLELKGHLHEQVFVTYKHLMNTTDKIPCEKLHQSVERLIWDQWLERLAIQRLERKTSDVFSLLNMHNYHIEEVFYHMLFKYVGKTHNAYAMEALIKSIPLKVLQKNSFSQMDVEALLLGQSSFFDNTFFKNLEIDEYTISLKNLYGFLAHKHQLQPIEINYWNFGKIRPSSLPSLVLAQLASFIHHSPQIWSEIQQCDSILIIREKFNVEISNYWNSHIALSKVSTKRKYKGWGKESIDNIIINVIIPMLFAQGKRIKNQALCDKAWQWLQEINSEKNSLVDMYAAMNIKAKNAADSQALIQLNHHYCKVKQCLQCPIGLRILKPIA